MYSEKDTTLQINVCLQTFDDLYISITSWDYMSKQAADIQLCQNKFYMENIFIYMGRKQEETYLGNFQGYFKPLL